MSATNNSYHSRSHTPYAQHFEYQTPKGTFRTYEEAMKALEACDYGEGEPIPVPIEEVNQALASFRSIL